MGKKTKTGVTVAEYVSHMVSKCNKSQRDIAVECGFESPNIIAMIKNGSTKVPLNRIGLLAKAIDADPAHLLRLAMSEYMPDTWCSIEAIMGEFMSAHEKFLVQQFRAETRHFDPVVHDVCWVDGRLSVTVDM